MTESALEAMLVAADEQKTSVDAITRKAGEDSKAGYEVTVHDGVAVIPVSGPLTRHYSWWSWLFDSGSYEVLARQIAAAVEDPEIVAVVLDVDSPGGEVTGCGELGQLIYGMRGVKPLIAYATGTCASAAYWLASSCDAVIVSKTAQVGSIGCRASVRDYRLFEEKHGVRTFDFVSSNAPYKASDPATEDGAQRIQKLVDRLGDEFVEAVATNRAVTVKKVQQDYGKGDVFVGSDAVKAGLADAIGTLEEVIQEFGKGAEEAAAGENTMSIAQTATVRSLAAEAKAFRNLFAKAKSEEDEKDENLEEDEDKESKAEEKDKDESAENEDKDESAADDDKDEDAEDEDDKETAKASGERARISAILTSKAAAGREALAQHLALSTNLSAKQAIATLKASPKAGAQKKGDGGFDAAMRAVGNPDVGAGNPTAPSSTTAEDAATRLLSAAAKELGLAR